MGIGVIGGAISGNLEVLDFDEPGLLEGFLNLLKAFDLDYLRNRLVIARTPDSGNHIYYRCSEPVQGNRKLAETEDRKARIETRGEGGYAIVPPSPGACHPTRIPYSFVQGNLSSIPTLAPSECTRLYACAMVFNLFTSEGGEHTESVLCGVQPSASGLRPGDDFNNTANWEDILQKAGWTSQGQCGEIGRWRRPSKCEGISATTNIHGTDLLYVFSSNAYPFEPNKSYNKFAAYSLLCHGGDYKAAAKQLASEEYGDKISSVRHKDKSIADTADPDKPEFRATDLGNAERLVWEHGENLRFVHQWGKWLIWNGSQWVLGQAGEVDRLAKRTVRNIYNEAAQEEDENRRGQLSKHANRSEAQNRLSAMVVLARTEDKIPIRISEIDTNKMLLNCQNGTLDLSSGELRAHKREDYCTKIIPIGYDPEAICPRWEAFLDRIFAGNRELTSFVQRAIGSALTGEVRDQCLFFLYGSGANGKSTFIETIRAMLDDYAMETPAETLMVKRNAGGIPNDVARLRGARFVSARESEENARLAESLIKQVTGGDKIIARFLHQEFFEFDPEFKLFLATNHRPVISGTDNGIWRRIRLIPFNVSIPDAERDPELPKKLLAELPGILAWVVRGCLEWESKGLGQPEIVRAATSAYRAEMDGMGTFIEEKCYLGEKARELAGGLYKAYETWCQDNGERAHGNNTFGRQLTERGIGKEKRGGTQFRIGIGLLSPAECGN